MGHKVSPYVQRIGITKNWRSVWFAKPNDYHNFIEEDNKIRRYVNTQFRQAAIADIIIERVTDKVTVKIFTARPGVIVGRHKADLEKLTDKVKDIVHNKEVAIDLKEVKEASSHAQLIAQNIAFQMEKRVAFRRAVKRAIEQAKNSGVKGIKIAVSGRLNGAEIARSEKYKYGKVPLMTLRADIDYGFAEALTTYGLIGVKVWVFTGDTALDQRLVLPQEESRAAASPAPASEKKDNPATAQDKG